MGTLGQRELVLHAQAEGVEFYSMERAWNRRNARWRTSRGSGLDLPEAVVALRELLNRTVGAKVPTYVQDTESRSYVVLETFEALYPVRTERRDLAIGARVEGRLLAPRATSQRPGNTGGAEASRGS